MKTHQELKTTLKQFSAKNFKSEEFITYFEVDKKQYRDVIKFLKEEKKFKFNNMIDLTAVDYPGEIKRFKVLTSFLSLKLNHRYIMSLRVAESESIDSIADIFPASIWYERELYDMFGIEVDDAPDLRRILTDYGFEGHPLRKDFPVTGFNEVRYDPASKKVVYEPVKLQQEFRVFDSLTPWVGTDYLKKKR